ncbi:MULTISPECIES: hypothetical protein [unclassified Methylobacterium]|nr:MULTISPECIES: hypothetical protein [unclassified Methylobacterium]
MALTPFQRAVLAHLARGAITFHPASIGGAWPEVAEGNPYRS